jgi:hypothetical protein
MANKQSIYPVNVLALYASNQMRTAAALLSMANGRVPLYPSGSGKGGSRWFRIEQEHFDCVINILNVLSNAKSNQQSIVVTLDDKNNITEAFEWTDKNHGGGRNITQTEINLINEGKLDQLVLDGGVLLDNDQ